MSISADIEPALQDPRLLEELYQNAVRADTVESFTSEIARRHTESPDNLLLAAWYYRLHPTSVAAAGQTERARRTNWPLAVALSLVLSVVYWVLSDQRFNLGAQGFPYLILVWAPAAACLILAFLTLAARAEKRIGRTLALIVGVLAVTTYAVWMAGAPHSTYHDLMILHLPLLAGVAVAWNLAGPGSDDHNRFAFLIKATEAVLTGGIFGGAAGVFVGVTSGLFQAIGIQFAEPVMRWLFAGVAGLVPVLAVATVYDPDLTPARQRFDQGLARLIFTVGRLFLP